MKSHDNQDRDREPSEIFEKVERLCAHPRPDTLAPQEDQDSEDCCYTVREFTVCS